ncbi:sorting nexin-24-like [Physella acuta]|uniref:sorting nexin-24-like n=1 Tax=Physella acuta TaxID=109671 RepID=UPI0027DE354E|nr:sorting nexin-24-like [Physella acuta]XP_059159981.1 sorting nexin-24-like [Physella acuta]
MVIRVNIPSFRKVKEGDETYTVFSVDVWVSGRHHVIEKRYSEFEELHKQLKKIIKTPEFPPKKVLKWNTKVLEQRRLALDSYFQGVVEQDPMPNVLLLFLETDMLDHSMDLMKVEEEQKTCHQAVISLDACAYLQESKLDSLPDIVSVGVSMGLYSTSMLQCH